MPRQPIFCLGIFFDSDSRNFCVRKMESKAVVFDGHGWGGGTSHLGPSLGPAQRRVQDGIRGGAVLSWGT